jgi:hypothetical protein
MQFTFLHFHFRENEKFALKNLPLKNSPFHFRRGRSPTAAQFASWPAVRPKLLRPFSSLGRPDSNTAALSAAFS